MVRAAPAGLAALLLAAASCQPADPRPEEASPSPGQDGAWPPSLDLLEFSESHRLGVLEGDPARMFGEVSGVAVDAGRGTVFILDELGHRLSAFTLSGEFIASAGGGGEGPGEFLRPVAVIADEAAVHALDWGANRITRFALDSDGLRHTGETQLPLSGATSFCRLGDDYLVMRYDEGRDGRILHRIDLDANVVSSFGSPFVEGSAFMANATDDGRLVCDEDHGRVYALSRAVPRVRGYSTNGALLWDIELPGVEIAIITEEGGGISWSPPRGRRTNDRPVTLLTVPGGRILVQCQEGVWGEATDLEAVARSFLIDGEDGTILDESRDIPRIELLSGSLALSKLDDLVPQVVIRERG